MMVAKSDKVGNTFSIPVTTTCTLGGITVHIPSLPSLVTTATDPDSAIIKLPPVTPISAERKCARNTSRASRVISGMSVNRGFLCTRENNSAISSLSLCMTGAMI